MPQRLSKVLPNPSLGVYPDAAERHPDRAAEVASVIAWWANVEMQLGLLFAFLLRTTAQEAVAILLELPNIETQLRVISAASNKALPPDQSLLFEAVRRGTIRPAQKSRNRLVHWVWAECTELPDAICLVNPSYMLERGARLTGTPFIDHTLKDFRINLDHVYVYREKDLGDVLRSVQLAHKCVHDFRALVSLSKGPSTARDTAERYSRLSSVPQVRSALDRLIADQKTPPEEMLE